MKIDQAKVLRKAATKIEQGWSKSFYARTIDGMPTPPTSRNAVSWCALGAMSCAAQCPVYTEEMLNLSLTLRNLTEHISISTYNDYMAKSAGEVATLMCFAADMIESGDL